MKSTKNFNSGIPISPSLNSEVEGEEMEKRTKEDKKRLLRISILAFVIAVAVSFIAKFLMYLIELITNLSFFGVISTSNAGPAGNSLGLWVIVIPALGGVIVGLMALYGSKAIRGHGIPEAMEQILTNQSKIKPTITYLKPLSSAISIGTGGPFGAEGPIIATGGALGSTLGQILKVSHLERKTLLAAGATAGMAAIFGSPIAAIFLAIELLLFEFSPRSILPVAIACITGAAGHHYLFSAEPIFAMDFIAMPSNVALFVYSILGIVIGILSIGVTKAAYFVEDMFEKLPIHWMWWPAIGGLIVGVIGYFAPRTMGVGYDNITEILSGNVTLQFMLSMCFLKFLSWVFALGSGTSGGTLAPLFTIGGAAGALLGILVNMIFPDTGITIPLAALIGMAAMFAGASRALLTSIIFALESTGQYNALLPLLGACLAAYFVSFFLMRHTIMTTKIERRGVKTPYSYEPDVLERLYVEQVLKHESTVISEENTVKEVREWLGKEKEYKANHLIIVNNDGQYMGVLNALHLYDQNFKDEQPVGTLINILPIYVHSKDTLRFAVELMAKEEIDVLPVLSHQNESIIGVLSYRDIIETYKSGIEDHKMNDPSISLKSTGMSIVKKGKKFVSHITFTRNDE